MKFNDMTKEQQKEYNAKLLEETDRVLDPEVDWLDKHPLLVHSAISKTRRTVSPDELLELLWKCGGDLTLAARTLRVTRTTIRSWLKKDDNMDVLKEIEEAWLDMAETELHRHIVESKNLEAIKFKLKTKGKSRGYYEKHEQEINQTIEVRLEAELPKHRDNRISQDEYDKKRLHGENTDEND